MPLTFLSKSLDRVVLKDELHCLTHQELQALRGELVIASRSMQIALDARLKDEQETGIPLDTDWTHKIRKKMEVCAAFCKSIEHLLEQNVPNGYLKQLISEKLEELLIEEVGERLYKELKEEAKDLALSDLQAQIRDA